MGDTVRGHQRGYGTHDDGQQNYYRLSVEQGLGNMELDEWKREQGRKTIDLTRGKSAGCLSVAKVQDQIKTVAGELVEIRRVPCARGGDRFQERQQLRIHTESDHVRDYNRGAIEDLIDSGQSFPLYDVDPRDYYV